MAHDDFAPIAAKRLPLRRAARSWAVYHAILALAWLAFAYLFIPKLEAILHDFGAALPASTTAAIKASHLVIRHFHLIVVAFAAALGFDLLMLDRLSVGKDGPRLARAWGLGLT